MGQAPHGGNLWQKQTLVRLVQALSPLSLHGSVFFPGGGSRVQVAAALGGGDSPTGREKAKARGRVAKNFHGSLVLLVSALEAEITGDHGLLLVERREVEGHRKM